MAEALLNPPADDFLGRKMLFIVEERLKRLDAKLLASALPQEEYLKIIGARLQVASLLIELQEAYNSEVLK